jgi:predicted transcriptional regulator
MSNDMLITFRCPRERVQLYMDLLMEQGITLTVKNADDAHNLSTSTPAGPKRRKHMEDVPITKTIFDMLEADRGTSTATINRLITQRGYAESTAGSALSRLLKAGFVKQLSNLMWVRVVPTYDHSAIIKVNDSYNRKRSNVSE